MKVFISWSGETSRHVARALRDWLPQVLQAVEPWLADTDLRPGTRWTAEIAGELEASAAVVACVTRDNTESTWLNYEAGAATRIVGSDAFFPLLVDLSPTELSLPLAQFQAVQLSDVGRLVSALNAKLENPLEAAVLQRVLALWLPDFEAAVGLGSISGDPGVREPALVTDRELLEAQNEQAAEILRHLEFLATHVKQVDERLARAELGGSTAPTGGPGAVDRHPRPRLFLGSSTEGLAIAETIQANLDHDVECTVWNQGLFKPSGTAIEGLVEATKAFDFAAIVMTADDTISKRGREAAVPRDNLVFELGLFTGTLGRARTFLVKSRDDDLELPTDLRGVTTIEYGDRTDGNLVAALAPVCLRMKEVMGVRRLPRTSD